MAHEAHDYLAKIISVGDAGVGKSSLLRMFYQGTFNDHIDGTLGLEFYKKIVTVADGKRVKLRLWDTAGQERFRSLPRVHYRGASATLLVFDVSSDPKNLVERLAHWLIEIKDWLTEIKVNTEDSNTPVFLVGNKCDLVDNGTSEAIEVGRKFASENNCEFMLTSAKTNTGLTELFASVAAKAIVFSQHKDAPLVHSDYGGLRAGGPVAASTSCC